MLHDPGHIEPPEIAEDIKLEPSEIDVLMNEVFSGNHTRKKDGAIPYMVHSMGLPDQVVGDSGSNDGSDLAP